MSLAKIPLIFCVSLAFKRCITSPNPAPPKDEQIQEQKSQVMEFSWYTQGVPKYATSLQFIAGLAEIATILAYQDPTSPLSKFILSWLVFKGGNPANLRLSMLTTIGGIMVITGTLIRVITYRYLGRFFRFEASIQRDHQLVTGGPYSIVRHPSYTGLLISHPGWFLWQFGRGSWVRESGLFNTVVGKAIVLSFAGLVILGTLYLTLTRMSNEDKALRKQFGAQWDQWASKVQYAVFPGIY
ncbi:hypothetical protein BDZ97DRAFT_1938246 [Flammula alnicola]|nr:hypothetical protein BDZ97DRAFT_1938246 [Flammula alnicola]